MATKPLSFRDKLKKSSNSLKDRHNAPVRAGSSFPNVFDKSKIPAGVEFYQIKEGSHLVDILPFQVGPDMPFGVDCVGPITEEGAFDYVVDLWVHTNVGSGKLSFVCPWENFQKECPICEYLRANRLEKEEWSNTRAKRRAIYLIWDRKNAETEKKGVQIMDVSHFFMEEKLIEISTLPTTGGREDFSHPDTGKTVCWTRKGTGGTNTQYLGHRFIDRVSPIPDAILEKTFPLDQIIKMHPSPEEISAAFYGNKVEDVKEVKEEKKVEEKTTFKEEKTTDSKPSEPATGKRFTFKKK